MHLNTLGKLTSSALLLTFMLIPAPATGGEPRFDPTTECTSEDRGPYPWDYQRIVEGHINQVFFDPSSIIDLEIYKPAPGWWSTAAFKTTRKNTKCYWYIPYFANGKNKFGGYVGRKAYALWVRDGIVMHSAERNGIGLSIRESGGQAFDEELEKLSAEEQERALALSLSDNSPEQQKPTTPSYINELKELAKLRDDGILTEEEFQRKKQEILGLKDDAKEEDGGNE